MNTDIRIKTSFFRHPKTLKLIKEYGPVAPLYIQKLWIFAAEMRPSGSLEGMSWSDICRAMEYDGEPKKFIGALLRCGFLDRSESGRLQIHDWEHHNKYASTAEIRISAARRGATSRWQTKQKQRDASCGLQNTAYAPSPAPSPVPSPAPVPAPAREQRPDRIWIEGIEYSTSRDAMGRRLKILK